MNRKMKKLLIRIFCLVWVVALCLSCAATALAADEACPYCGKDVPEGIVICPHCWVCTECGAQNNENAVVCAECGAQNAGGGTSGGASEGSTGEGSGDSSGSSSEGDSSTPDSDSSNASSTNGTAERPAITQDNADDFTPIDLETIYFNTNIGHTNFFCYPADLPLPLNIAEYFWAEDLERPDLLQKLLKETGFTTVGGKPVYMLSTALCYKSTDTSWDFFEPSKELLCSTPGWKLVAERDLEWDDGEVEGGGNSLSRHYYFESEQRVAVRDSDGSINDYPACLIVFYMMFDSQRAGIGTGGILFYCYVAEDALSAFEPQEPSESDTSSGSSGGNQIIQLEDGTYVTVDENGEINTDPSYSGITQEEDGTYTNQTDTLPVPDYRDYEVGDIVTVGGVAFVLLLVAGVPTWVGPGGIGLDGKSLIPEDGPADTGPKPEPAEPDTPKEPQEEVTPTDEDSGGETGTDGWKDTSGYITEAMKGTPIVTEIMDLLFIMDESGVNVAKLAGPLASAGFDFIDFSAQGSDAVTAGIKTLISAGMKMAAGAGASYTDVALNAMKYEFCEFAKQFENFTGIDTSGIQDMASRITSSVSPGENLKNTAGVMVDFFREGYKCFVTKEGNEFTTSLIEGYRSGKYGENMKNMQLSIDMINDYFSGKPVLEEIRTGLGQMLEETNQSISDYISKGLMGQ